MNTSKLYFNFNKSDKCVLLDVSTLLSSSEILFPETPCQIYNVHTCADYCSGYNVDMQSID